MHHFGTILRQLRDSRKLSQRALAEKIQKSDESVSKWEKQEWPAMRTWIYHSIAQALGMEKAELDKAWEAPPDWEKVVREKKIEKLRRKGRSRAELSEGFDLNVEPYSETSVPEIPTFDLPLAAGPWLELAEVEELRDQRMLNDGRFRVYLRGDSMEKKYPNGSLVEFRCLRPEIGDGRGSKLEVGKDYYVQKQESATFKRLESFDDESLTFVAINRRKYPDKIRVLREEVKRMAKAVYILSKAD